MSMTRKDYDLIADALRSAKPDELGAPMDDWDAGHDRGAHSKWAACVGAVTAALRSTNPRFDAERFKLACGVKRA